jgi:hypothetical protein
VIFALFCADLQQPLTKSQVCKAVTELLRYERTVKRLSLMRDGKAGDLGYFFVELYPKGFMIIIADARFPPVRDDSFLRKDKTYAFHEYFLDFKNHPLVFQSNAYLKITTLLNKLIGRKTRAEIYWDKFKE